MYQVWSTSIERCWF